MAIDPVETFDYQHVKINSMQVRNVNVNNVDNRNQLPHKSGQRVKLKPLKKGRQSVAGTHQELRSGYIKLSQQRDPTASKDYSRRRLGELRNPPQQEDFFQNPYLRIQRPKQQPTFTGVKVKPIVLKSRLSCVLDKLDSEAITTGDILSTCDKSSWDANEQLTSITGVLSWARQLGLTNRNSDILKWSGTSPPRSLEESCRQELSPISGDQTVLPGIEQDILFLDQENGSKRVHGSKSEPRNFPRVNNTPVNDYSGNYQQTNVNTSGETTKERKKRQNWVRSDPGKNHLTFKGLSQTITTTAMANQEVNAEYQIDSDNNNNAISSGSESSPAGLYKQVLQSSACQHLGQCLESHDIQCEHQKPRSASQLAQDKSSRQSRFERKHEGKMADSKAVPGTQISCDGTQARKLVKEERQSVSQQSLRGKEKPTPSHGMTGTKPKVNPQHSSASTSARKSLGTNDASCIKSAGGLSPAVPLSRPSNGGFTSAMETNPNTHIRLNMPATHKSARSLNVEVTHTYAAPSSDKKLASVSHKKLRRRSIKSMGEVKLFSDSGDARVSMLKVRNFISEPKSNPTAVIFHHPTAYRCLAHSQIFEACTKSLKYIDRGKLISVRYEPLSTILATNGMDDRWILQLDSEKAAEHLTLHGLSINDKYVYVEPHDRVMALDYSKYLRMQELKAKQAKQDLKSNKTKIKIV